MSKEQENKAIVGRWFTEFWVQPVISASSTSSPRRTCSCSIRCTSRGAAAKTSRPSCPVSVKRFRT